MGQRGKVSQEILSGRLDVSSWQQQSQDSPRLAKKMLKVWLQCQTDGHTAEYPYC